MNLTAQDLGLLNTGIKHISLPIGVVAILAFNQPFPNGWERLSYEEAQPYMQYLKQMLGQWSIVAFQNGKLDGEGYGYKYSPTYGQECGEGFILKRVLH